MNSCNVYEISWRNYSTYSDENIKLKFQNNEKVNLKLNKTKRFRLFTQIDYIIEFERQYGCYIYVYPFFNINTESEIFFYNINIINQNEKSIIIEERKDVEAYFAEFYIDNLRYNVISKDNILAITEPKEFTNINDILSYIETSDFTFITAGRTDYDGVVKGGYIVRSKIDSTILWLEGGL